jgi:hypothetical protein
MKTLGDILADTLGLIKICLNPGIEYNDHLKTWEVKVIDPDGRVYTLARQFNTALDAATIMAKIAERGFIDPTYWNCRVPYGSNAWDDDGMEVALMDDEERHHKGM